jgi:hypothetical protein
VQNTPTLRIGDTKHQMTKFYLDGARAYRKDTPFWENPFNEGTQRFHEWNCGYENEEAGEHMRFGIDLVEECEPGAVYNEDPDLERGQNGYLVQRN